MRNKISPWQCYWIPRQLVPLINFECESKCLNWLTLLRKLIWNSLYFFFFKTDYWHLFDLLVFTFFWPENPVTEVLLGLDTPTWRFQPQQKEFPRYRKKKGKVSSITEQNYQALPLGSEKKGVNLEACQYWFDATHPPCPWLKKSPCFVVIGQRKWDWLKWNCYPGSAQREQQSDAFWVEEEGRLV